MRQTWLRIPLTDEERYFYDEKITAGWQVIKETDGRYTKIRLIKPEIRRRRNNDQSQGEQLSERSRF